jgi:hypothetical protein
MKVLLIKDGDGVAVRIPAPGITIEELLGSAEEARVVDDSQLPDREFRDAWTFDGKVNLAKAKKIWAQKIRLVRNAKLADLDIKWMQAMERGEVKIAAAIGAQKQVLRDLTEREELTNAASLDEIKAFWPDVLR